MKVDDLLHIARFNLEPEVDSDTQRSIAASLLAIALLLDRVTRSGQALDVNGVGDR